MKNRTNHEDRSNVIAYLNDLERRKSSPAFDELKCQFRRINGCPVTTTLQVIGGKWKPIILYMISHEVNRFGELQRIISGISKKVLTQQLRELEEATLIARHQLTDKPLKIVYELTTNGLSLMPVLDAMCAWGLETAHLLVKD